MARNVKARVFMGRKAPTGVSQSADKALAGFNSSTSDVIGALNDFINDLGDILPEVLVEALEPTLGKSLAQVPRDTEALANSAYLEAESRYRHVAVSLGYARNNNPPYAIYVHEMPYEHAAPTKAKFLQDPLNEDYFKIINSLPRLIREKAGT